MARRATWPSGRWLKTHAARRTPRRLPPAARPARRSPPRRQRALWVGCRTWTQSWRRRNPMLARALLPASEAPARQLTAPRLRSRLRRWRRPSPPLLRRRRMQQQQQQYQSPALLEARKAESSQKQSRSALRHHLRLMLSPVMTTSQTLTTAAAMATAAPTTPRPRPRAPCWRRPRRWRRGWHRTARCQMLQSRTPPTSGPSWWPAWRRSWRARRRRGPPPARRATVAPLWEASSRPAASSPRSWSRCSRGAAPGGPPPALAPSQLPSPSTWASWRWGPPRAPPTC
jgi:hypothetical protein